ncbi:MAG: DUF4242 domain-containing protein [candidate division Zixibacteria bacterium]|nr:DUF4242 domain-containing protein [candidate division Zixibacteria bacterium]
MNTYVILRRKFWARPEDLEKSASISSRIGLEEMPDQVKWIRSYVVKEEGKLGTVCIYQGTSPEAIREHARRVGMPADEVIPVGDLVVVNDDPAK